jgi:hypothetical protein
MAERKLAKRVNRFSEGCDDHNERRRYVLAVLGVAKWDLLASLTEVGVAQPHAVERRRHR